MPYIKKERRKALYNDSTKDYNDKISTAGELNFFITERLIEYVEHKGLSYQTINDVVGALDGAKFEFYRRVAVPYENKKKKENGDVY
jgi:glycyl-tRNA synthetase beta subunit